jgi:UDP:flavonoid glycosyltransferase YjiC (YdhE family)
MRNPNVPEILIAALSPTGHISPLLTVAQDLVARGNRVTVMTGAAHADAVRAVGARLQPLAAVADFDESPFDASHRGRTPKIRALNLAIIRLLLAPMPHQAAELSAALAANHFDAVIADYGFFGVIPFLLGDPADRPPILHYTPTPMLERLGAHRLPMFLLDVGVLADRFIVPTVPAFEYPRSDLPPNVRFVGAVHQQPSAGCALPEWWSALDDERPVVHVTQGTVDNADTSRLIEPTVAALGEEDVTVVVSTGGRDIAELRGSLPANTHVVECIPHEVLLPRVNVMVTNGGYGAVQRALSAGVPLVVAGSTEDKPEVAARVARSGAGIDLRTGTPSPGMIRDAVRTVLADGRYLRRARELEVAFAQRDGVAEIAALGDELIYDRRQADR